ncbi:MAG: hypothetical protein Q4E89_03435 [Eubacteriales bacterium]|nr:hypothetical protein [Eubacteriales bacterium]
MSRLYHKKMTKLLAATAALCLVFAGNGTRVIFADAVPAQRPFIPDSVTIDSSAPLGEIELPDSECGVLHWADSSYIPTSSGEACEVIFEPYDSADYEGWESFDAETGTLSAYINVIILDDDADTKENSGSGEDYTAEEEDGEELPSREDAEGEETTGEESSKQPSEENAEGEETTREEDSGQLSGENTEIEEITEQEGNELPSEEEDGEEILSGEQIPENAEPSEDEGTDVNEENTNGASGDGLASSDGSSDNGADISEVEDQVTEDIFEQAEIVDNRPATLPAVEEISEEEQQQLAAQNHTSQGITVTGSFLPWYVQFQVSGGSSYVFANEEDATIFQAYEFELWDTISQTEYQIPDGEYITVTVPVKEGYSYVIEHLLDNGAVETIIPYVEGSTMIFQTYSFSPFGIAGSRPLVGTDLTEDGYSDANTGEDENTQESEEPGTQATPSVTQTAGASSQSTVATGTSAPSQAEASPSSDTQTNTNNANSVQKTVKTGDDTNIVPFVIILSVAVILIIGAVIVILKRKK